MKEVESLKLYEVGYLISPLVQEAEVGESVEQIIRGPIGARGGQVTGELAPVMRRLAYRVANRLAAKRSYFHDAYFGAIRFESSPEDIAEIKLAWEKRDELLRYILIALPKGSEKTIHLRRYAQRPAVSQAPILGQTDIASKMPMTTEEIDKEIEGLLVDNKDVPAEEVKVDEVKVEEKEN